MSRTYVPDWMDDYRYIAKRIFSRYIVLDLSLLLLDLRPFLHLTQRGLLPCSYEGFLNEGGGA